MQITVNEDLNLYAFLITYIHEVAHAAVSQQSKRRVPPHGKAWQTAFQRLMQPLLTEAVFPRSILMPLQQYMARPAATTYAHPALMTALRHIEAGDESKTNDNKVQLRYVTEGQTFDLAKKTFIRGTLRRTRVVCKEVSTGKSYAVLAHIWVDVVKNKE